MDQIEADVSDVIHILRERLSEEILQRAVAESALRLANKKIQELESKEPKEEKEEKEGET